MTETYSRHLLLLVNFFIILIMGVTGQTVRVNEPQTVTDCSQGLRDQQDKFIITGDVDASGLIIGNWRYIEYFAAIGGADFRSVCFTDLTSCSNTPSAGCYCVNKGSNTYQIVINQTSTVEYSHAGMKLMWTTIDNSQSVESQVVQLPQIYGQNGESITLKVNDEEKELTSTSCIFSLKEGRNDISYCCTNSPSPCAITITHDGIDVVGDRCLQIRVLETAAGLYTFTHAVCGRVSGTVRCEATTGNTGNITNATTLSPSQEATNSTLSDSDKIPDWGIATIALASFFFLLSVILLICCVCQMKRKGQPQKGHIINKK